ncbi:SMP-30/gluconolactonase/LRE family protein [Leptospira sp. 96542]|nr:SMP-30/gluconolactonase/LRE family protein [Leptospira sp. 96542]
MNYKLTFQFFILFFFLISCNRDNIRIGKSHELGAIPDDILNVQQKSDPFLMNLKVDMLDLPGHDDIIFDGKNNIAYASGMDGWIWKLNFREEKATQWIKTPVNPAGMQFANSEKNKILVCASKLGGESYNANDRVGLYEIDTKTKTTTPLIIDLPITVDPEPNFIAKKSNRLKFKLKDLNAQNSRPFALCNDLAVSADGNRIYLTEPFVRENASMGSGAVPEAIGLYPHGKLWMYDRKENSISLMLDGFTFIDGILLESNNLNVEESVLFTETTKFRIIRAYIAGWKEGDFEVLHENLPGLADGMERDDKGNIWVGIIKRRSGVMNFLHNNSWLKSFVLSLPQKLLPISKQTGILALSPDAKKPLYYVMHDGSKITDISVAVPFKDRIYFPSFDKKSKGLYSMPSPLDSENSK